MIRKDASIAARRHLFRPKAVVSKMTELDAAFSPDDLPCAGCSKGNGI